MERFTYEHLLIFLGTFAAAFFLVLRLLPGLLLGVYKRAILKKGFGFGPIPVNTLFVQPPESFADPLKASASKFLTTGVNRDTLIAVGWLDLKRGPLLLSVPDMQNRYYSVQFTDPIKNVTFAYVGTRATGGNPGKYLLCGPRWKGTVPEGVSRIASPRSAVLVVGRVLVTGEDDLPAAYALASQIHLAALPPENE